MTDVTTAYGVLLFAGVASFIVAYRIALWCATKVCGFLLKKMGLI